MITPPYLKKIYFKSDFDRREGYPFDLPIFKKDNFSLEFTKPLTIVVGENGTGKSTLLECIADHCGFNLSGGNKNHHSLDQRNDVYDLTNSLRFSWSAKQGDGFFMRAESLFNFANHLDDMKSEQPRFNWYGAYGGESLNEKSHGEAFMNILLTRFKKGVYILDEPEAALSPARQIALLRILKDAQNDGVSQIIIATHSPIIMSYPNAQLLEITDGSFHETEFKNTAHYNLYARFLDHPEKYHDEIFND